jgi:ketosteroid isomerase-like protein
MAHEHPNAVVVWRFYEAFAARDFAALRELFAEDCVWHIPGHSPISGHYKGVDAVVDEFLKGVVSRSSGTLKAEALDVLVNDRHVIVLQRSTGQQAGESLDLTVCQVFRVENGKIAEVTPHYSDLYALDAFWSAHAADEPPA